MPFQGRTLCVIIVCGNLLCHDHNRNWKSRGKQAELDSGSKGARGLSGMTIQKRYVPVQNMLDLHSQQGTPSEFMSVLNYST